MKRDLNAAELEYIRRLLEQAPPLSEVQKSIIRAAFAGTDAGRRSTG